MNTEVKEKNKLEEKKNIIKIFEATNIRTKWDAEKEDYYFSVVDVIKALTDSSIEYKNNIVDVVIDSKIENFVKLRDIMISKGAVEVNPKFVKNEVADTSIRTKIDANEGVAVSMVKYLKETKKSDINNEKLLKCFKEVLNRVKKG